MLSGIGVGMVLPALSAAAVNRLPEDQYAVGSAVNQAIRQIGSLLGVTFIVLLVGHMNPSRSDFARAYAIQVALAIVTALLCLRVSTRPQATKPRWHRHDASAEKPCRGGIEMTL